MLLNLGGRRVRAYFDGRTGYHPERVKKYTVSDYTITDGPLCDEVDQLTNDETDIDTRETKISTDVWALIKSVSSVKRLLEVWPEAEKLLPATSALAAKNLPAVQTAELNKLLGLGG